MTTTETITVKQWKTEAGPRQTKQVQDAFYNLRTAGSGSLYLRTSPRTGEHTEHVETCMFSLSPAEKEQKNRCITALNDLFDQYEGTITRGNFKEIIAAAQAKTAELTLLRPVVDERKTAEQVKTENEEREQARAAEEAKQAEEAERSAVAVTALLKEYPHLSHIADKHPGGVDVAKNMRKHLKHEFPGVKFSVTADHSSVNVKWMDGPSAEQVEKEANRFQAGTFDSMTDCPGWSADDFNNAFGGVRYVFTRRDFSEYAGHEGRLSELVKAAILENMPGATPYELDQHSYKAIRHCDMRGVGAFKGVTFDMRAQRYILDFEPVETPAPAAPTTASTPAQGVTIEEHTHTKKGFQMWIVILSARLERDEYTAHLERAKELGGWYSRKWGTAPAGFAFKDKDAAETFAEGLGGGTDPKGDCPPPSKKPQPKTDGKAVAERLRTMADKMQDTIDNKQAPMTQNPTPKRSLEYRCRRIDGDHLERVQTALQALADGHEKGTLPAILSGVRTKKALMTYLHTRTDHSGGCYSVIDTGEYSDTSAEAVAIQELIDKEADPDAARARLIENKLLDLAGAGKVEGFFVTPSDTVGRRVIEEATISDGETVLEPSAGVGNLADLAREAGGVISCIELRPAFCEILRLKGFPTECDDFTECETVLYDKIVMNPPFEKGQDADHVRKAYEKHLKDGGRLVAIMGEGSFFRSDPKATAFREWLEGVGGCSKSLPEGSFLNTGEITSTGVNTRIVTIDK